MPADKYFPDTKEPHLHYHKGGVTYAGTKHNHKDLVAGDQTRKANCQSVYDELKNGNDREKKIAAEIKKEWL